MNRWNSSIVREGPGWIRQQCLQEWAGLVKVFYEGWRIDQRWLQEQSGLFRCVCEQNWSRASVISHARLTSLISSLHKKLSSVKCNIQTWQYYCLDHADFHIPVYDEHTYGCQWQTMKHSFERSTIHSQTCEPYSLCLFYTAPLSRINGRIDRSAHNSNWKEQCKLFWSSWSTWGSQTSHPHSHSAKHSYTIIVFTCSTQSSYLDTIKVVID